MIQASLDHTISRCCASPRVRAGGVVLSRRTPVRLVRPPCHRTRQVPLATRPIGGFRLKRLGLEGNEGGYRLMPMEP